MSTPDDGIGLDAALDALPATYLECRDWGHSWRPFTASYNAKERHYVQSLQCNRCGTVRDRLLGPRGQLLGNSYEYADGYLMPSGIGHLSSTDRDGIRLRSINHVIEDGRAAVTPIKRGKRK
jgi:hypothetical protein